MNLFTLILVLLAAAFIVRMIWLARPGITPTEADAALKAGTAVLVDIREPAEWSGGVAKPAVLLAFSDLRGARSGWRPFLEKHRDKQLVLYCASGSRSGMAAGLLRREGFKVANLGGLSRWASAGLPVVRPKR